MVFQVIWSLPTASTSIAQGMRVFFILSFCQKTSPSAGPAQPQYTLNQWFDLDINYGNHILNLQVILKGICIVIYFMTVLMELQIFLSQHLHHNTHLPLAGLWTDKSSLTRYKGCHTCPYLGEINKINWDCDGYQQSLTTLNFTVNLLIFDFMRYVPAEVVFSWQALC